MSNNKRMNRILVVDVESTCWPKGEQPDGATSEVIEIGIAEVDQQSLEVVSSRSIMVKPHFSTVSAFCTELTTITPEQLEADGIPFDEACKILHEYRSKIRMWASWGDYDKKMFRRICGLWQSWACWGGDGGLRTVPVPYPFGPRHLNVKSLFAHSMGLGKEVSVAEALKILGRSFDGTAHRGIDDARNIAGILCDILYGARQMLTPLHEKWKEQKMAEENKPKTGMLVEDETVVAGTDESTGETVVAPKTSDGKAPKGVAPTDKREASE